MLKGQQQRDSPPSDPAHCDFKPCVVHKPLYPFSPSLILTGKDALAILLFSRMCPWGILGCDCNLFFMGYTGRTRGCKEDQDKNLENLSKNRDN